MQNKILQPVIEKINKIQNKGLFFYLNIINKSIVTFLKPVYRTTYIFETKIGPTQSIQESNDITVQILTRINQQMEDFAKRRGSWYLKQACELFLLNNICFAIVIDNKIVSVVWTSFKNVNLTEIEYILPVPEDTVPLIDGYTLEEYRGKGLYKILWQECSNYFTNLEKYSKIYGFINPKNIKSIKVHNRLNLTKIIQKITLIKIFGTRFYLKKEIK